MASAYLRSLVATADLSTMAWQKSRIGEKGLITSIMSADESECEAGGGLNQLNPEVFDAS